MISDPINNKKYNLILLAAKNLFWKHGIKRVSVEEICDEAGVSKMTFYRYFENKIELAKTVLDHVMEDSIEKYHMIMKENISFNEKIKKTILLKFEGTREISSEFLHDIFQIEDTDLRKYFEQYKEENIRIILNDYIAAQKKGWIRKDLKPEFILYYINKMFEMGNDASLLRLYNNAQDLIMELTNFFFFGILPRDKTDDES